MSLIKKLWLAIAIIMLLAFGGSLVVSTISSKIYLEKQLEMKNIDNAASLALSMSKIENLTDIELMISAQFDSGHYQYISLTSPEGELIIEKSNPNISANVPIWFTKLIPIRAHSGVAHVQKGWTQVGTIKLVSDATFAYKELWNSTLIMLLWSSIVAFFSGLIGTFLLQKIFRPINEVVNQAEAIGNKRFITLAEPNILEFKVLVSAMNRLSNRIREMFNDESKLLEALRKEANFDYVTSLMNKKYFTSRVSAYIANEDTFTEGVLVISHLSELADINNKIGEAETDALLRRLADALKQFRNDDQTILLGRVGGADLAVFIGKPVDPYMISTQIQNLLINAASTENLINNMNLPTISSKIHRSDQLDSLKQLVSIVRDDINTSDFEERQIFEHDESLANKESDERTWFDRLTNSINAKRVKLASYPVVDRMGDILHYESPVRMQLETDGPWLSANEFILWASRLNLMTKIDELVLQAAIDSLKEGSAPIGLNISTRAICNADFVMQMKTLISQNPQIAHNLWLEVPELSVFAHLAEFRDFCAKIKPLGCKIGIEHVGAKVSRLGELFDYGVDFIKVDVSVVRGIDKNPGNQAFLRGLCLIAHSIGLTAIAEGVETESELECLPTLGIDGMTGPGVKTGSK